MPTTLSPVEILVRSNLELLSDGYEMVLAHSALFTDAAPDQTVNIALGFEDEIGQPVYATVLENAVIDERELTVEPDGIRTRVRGRDATAALMDRDVQILYRRAPVAEELDAIDPVEPVETKVGHFTARDVIADLVDRVGLDLAFQVRDYELLEDFSASGRIKDVIDQLLEPWNLTTPFKVDVTLEGKTLWIRHRPQAFDPPADYTYDVRDARIGRMAIRRRIARRFGHVRLEGKRSQSSLDPPATEIGEHGEEVPVPEIAGGNVWLTGLKVETRTLEDTYKGSELVTRIETVTTTLYPDETVTKIVKTTYAGEQKRLVSRETTENDYERSVYEEGRLVNQPKLRRTVVTVETPVRTPSGGTIFKISQFEEKKNHYDSLNFLTGATTIVSELNKKTDQLERKSMRVEKLVATQPLVFQSEVSSYRFSKKTGDWELETRSIQDNPGRPPGGPGRRSPELSIASPAGSGEGGPGVGIPGLLFEPIVLEDTISEEPDAETIHYANPHLELDDLQFVMQQLRDASGVWEWEISLTGATMPWLRRGMRIQFTGLEDGNGDEIEVPAALLMDLSMRHTEDGAPQALSELVLLCWTEVA